MTIRQILATSVTALALVSTPALHAATTSIASPVHAIFTKVKMVKVHLRNDSGSQIELRVGDSLMKIENGQTLNLNLATGTKVLTNTATPKLTAGSVIAEVAPYLDGATLSIH
jgi:hypothetical protein